MSLQPILDRYHFKQKYSYVFDHQIENEGENCSAKKFFSKCFRQQIRMKLFLRKKFNKNFKKGIFARNIQNLF